MKSIKQINESSYESFNTFLKSLKINIKNNFDGFAPNDHPDPNEYKKTKSNEVVFGDFPETGSGVYVLKFDFQDWKSATSMYKDMVFVLNQLNQQRAEDKIVMKKLVIHLVHYIG